MADTEEAVISPERKGMPVLCFGDSLTEGYLGVWPHPVYGPDNAGTDELGDLRFHPYSIKLGARLANDVGAGAAGYAAALRFATCRACSGWTAQELLPELRAALREREWRAAVILAGSNDIIINGDGVSTALSRVLSLYAACEAAGVPVVAVTNPAADLKHHGLVPVAEVATREAAIADLAVGIAAACARDGRVVVDARQALVMDAEHLHLWDDSIHFSPVGSDCLADLVYEALHRHGL